jgi:hypothetical protein
MYKITNKMYGGEASSVIRLSDDTCIPFDPDNTDYQAFLKYQAEGGKVYGADEPLPADEENT